MTITAINVRNQFRGKVREIIVGPVVSEVDVETPTGLTVTSVITTRSIKELGLVVGDTLGQPLDQHGRRRPHQFGSRLWLAALGQPLGDSGRTAAGARAATGVGQLFANGGLRSEVCLLVFRMN